MPDTVTEDTIQEQVVDKRNACVLEIGRNVANGFGARHLYGIQRFHNPKIDTMARTGTDHTAAMRWAQLRRVRASVRQCCHDIAVGFLRLCSLLMTTCTSTCSRKERSKTVVRADRRRGQSPTYRGTW